MLHHPRAPSPNKPPVVQQHPKFSLLVKTRDYRPLWAIFLSNACSILIAPRGTTQHFPLCYHDPTFSALMLDGCLAHFWTGANMRRGSNCFCSKDYSFLRVSTSQQRWSTDKGLVQRLRGNVTGVWCVMLASHLQLCNTTLPPWVSSSKVWLGLTLHGWVALWLDTCKFLSQGLLRWCVCVGIRVT